MNLNPFSRASQLSPETIARLNRQTAEQEETSNRERNVAAIAERPALLRAEAAEMARINADLAKAREEQAAATRVKVECDAKVETLAGEQLGIAAKWQARLSTNEAEILGTMPPIAKDAIAELEKDRAETMLHAGVIHPLPLAERRLDGSTRARVECNTMSSRRRVAALTAAIDEIRHMVIEGADVAQLEKRIAKLRASLPDVVLEPVEAA